MNDQPNPIFRRGTLGQRLFALIVLGFVIVTGGINWRTESIIEDTIFSQVKQQALVFLHGVGQQLEQQGSPLDPPSAQAVLQQAVRPHKYIEFSINRLYIYDRDGRIIAHAGASKPPTRDVNLHYGNVFRTGKEFTETEVESLVKDGKKQQTAHADIIIPIFQGKQVVAGLEVELDLDKTLQRIKQIDNAHENDIWWFVSLATLAGLGLIGLVVNNGLINPINHIGLVARQIAEGKLAARIKKFGYGEIGRLGQDINQMADNLERMFNEQEEAYIQSLQSLAKALEAKDPYTAKHSARVSKFSVMLGRRIGLPEEELVLLKKGALMHDLGKIGIPDAILNKPGPLDDEEYEVMCNHPVDTAAIMQPLKRFKAFAEIAAWHHERWDGNGYPDGLKGEEIPLPARIVAIADTWDAMTGDRVYRKGMPIEKALSILEKEHHSGQWDPDLLERFIEMIRSEQHAREEVEEDIYENA